MRPPFLCFPFALLSIQLSSIFVTVVTPVVVATSPPTLYLSLL
jgi:hypothetical protein